MERPPTRPGRPLRPHPDHEGVLRELGPRLFGSLARRDQQSTAVQYVHALLSTPGRKSVRNIARSVGGTAAAQRLHHFVSRSPWHWGPVRAATARHLVDIVTPEAWVVRRTVIPKAGCSSVGVGRAFDPGYGRVVNAQRALDVWAVSRRGSGPVEWDLLLPDAWLSDARFRTAAEIPDHIGPAGVTDLVVRMWDGMVGSWGLPSVPVVTDARELDAEHLVHGLAARAIECLVRVRGQAAVLPGDGGRPVPAQELLRRHGRLRRPVGSSSGPADQEAATALVLPVALPGSGARAALLGIGGRSRDWPGETWVTTIAAPEVASLVRYTRLLRHVEREFAVANRTVGLSDFTGRSFGGWHRHVTLASVAHTVSQHLRAGGLREACSAC